MAERTCAACDCELDANSIKIKIGGKTVEVSCDECAQKLKEAYASTAAAGEGENWTGTAKDPSGTPHACRQPVAHTHNREPAARLVPVARLQRSYNVHSH